MKIREVNLAGGLVRVTRDVEIEGVEDMAGKRRRYRDDGDGATTMAPTEVGSTCSPSIRANLGEDATAAAAMNGKTIRWDSPA